MVLRRMEILGVDVSSRSNVRYIAKLSKEVHVYIHFNFHQFFFILFVVCSHMLEQM